MLSEKQMDDRLKLIKKAVRKVRMQYKKLIKVVPVNSYNIIEYRFFTPDQEEIKL